MLFPGIYDIIGDRKQGKCGSDKRDDTVSGQIKRKKLRRPIPKERNPGSGRSGGRYMGDFYTEKMVKRKAGGRELAPAAGLAAAALISAYIALSNLLGVLLVIIFVGLCVIAVRRSRIEYEYLFINGDLDIDKIINRSSRKTVFSMNVSELELLAPEGNRELERYGNARMLDFSSNQPAFKRYVLVAGRKGELYRVVFEPGEELVEGFFLMAPRKVLH